MSVRRFLSYVQYSTICPDGVNPYRWAGMLRWFETRMRLCDGLDLEG